MKSKLDLLAPIARILLALIYVMAGIDKLGNIARPAASIASHGIPFAEIMAWGAMVLELGGGLMLMAGLLARLVAFAFFLYTLALAVVFHPYWTFTGDAVRVQHGYFFGHLSMMGGMLLVVALGAGAYSLNSLIWRRSASTP